MLKIVNKKNIIFVVVSVVIILCVLRWLQTIDQKKYSKNLPSVHNKIVSAFNTQKAYNTAFTTAVSNLSGDLATPSSFQGTYKVVSQDKNGKSVSSDQYAVTRVGDDTFVKKEDEESYKKENNMFAYELSILTHPDWIQLQKRLDDKEIDGNTYLQYEVIFEKPDQEITKTMSPEQLDELRIKGTILVKKSNFQLKETKLYQGKDSNNSFTVEYQPTDTAPIIKAPF